MGFARLKTALAAGVLVCATSGCIVDRDLAPCLGAALCFGAELATEVAADVVVHEALHHHHHHHHHYGCGCPTQIWRGQRIWWYGGHWEFYSNGSLYIVRNLPPPY